MNLQSSKNNRSIEDFLRLPFEVYYEGPVGVVEFDFKSDSSKIKSIRDVKIVLVQRGEASGVTMSCESNTGPELCCCLLNSHDEVNPPWLSLESEEDIDFNDGEYRKVAIVNDVMKFQYLSEEEEDEDSDEFIDVESMDSSVIPGFFGYLLDTSEPEYVVLDSNNSRVKVSLSGYVLDDSNNETTERLFDPEDLRDREDLEDYSTYELREMIDNWFADLISKNFPKEKKLKILVDL